ncbi:MAG: macro domain-containing protein [Oscillospiraceae bacterium]|nr:macro domain-containing protein [Oscillospiraceae bacterium]MCL2277892.1 macro domain-containing protein [Oscillospiraceae bacterium]
MIKTVQGNILDAREKVIGHQVNCKGIMGAGLAKSIKAKYPVAYERYKASCKRHGDSLLGVTVIGHANLLNPPYYIANIFGQLSAGRSKQHTDYTALRSALASLAMLMQEGELDSLALPYKLGCGLGGGDWNVVENIIHEIFDESGIDVTIYQITEH